MAILVLLALGLPALLRAEGPPCGRNQYEIAWVHDAKGKFQDSAYGNRPLAPNAPVCSDSTLVHVKDGRQSPDDQLVLRDFAGKTFPLRCGDNLNCNNPDELRVKVHDELRKRLKGQTLFEAVAAFFHRSDRSTIPRGMFGPSVVRPVFLAFGETWPFPEPYDLCLHADQTDHCSDALPRPAKGTIRDLPPGLHVVWEAKPLPRDTVPIRVEATAVYLVAAHASWKREDLDSARTCWSAILTSPDAQAEQLGPALALLADRLAHPKRP